MKYILATTLLLTSCEMMLNNEPIELDMVDYIQKIETSPYDSLEISTGITVDSFLNLEDELVLAMLLYSECRGCIREEIEVVAHVIYSRARENFDSMGHELKQQILAKRQFSNTFRRGKTVGNMIFDYQKEKSVLCLEIAKKTLNEGGTALQRKLPCNLHYFCNSRIATNQKEVNRQKKYKYDLPLAPEILSKFGHDIFSLNKKCEC